MSALAVLFTAAFAQAAILTPDGESILISKSIGDARWTIVQRLDSDSSVSGNVYDSSGGPARYLWCFVRDASDTDYRLACSGATECQAPCTPEWQPLHDVDVPIPFFRVGDGTAPLESLLGVWVFRFGVEFTDVVSLPGNAKKVVGKDAITGKQVEVVETGLAPSGFRYELHLPELGEDVCEVYRFDLLSDRIAAGALSIGELRPDGACTHGTFWYVFRASKQTDEQ